jgi:hypothetical protein
MNSSCGGGGIASAETPNTTRHGKNIVAIFTMNPLPAQW